MKPSHSKHTRIRGIIAEGLKESSLFTHIPWVRDQFIKKLGIDPYPGTLNLEIVDDRDREAFKQIKKQKGAEIIPAQADFCAAKCFHVLVCGKVKGALIIPQVSDYPESKLEIISSMRIRDALSLDVGDTVSVDIL